MMRGCLCRPKKLYVLMRSHDIAVTLKKKKNDKLKGSVTSPQNG